MLKLGAKSKDGVETSNLTEKNNKKQLTLKHKTLIALGAVLLFIVIILATVYGTFLHYYNKMNITSVGDNDEIVTNVDYEDDDLNLNDLTDEERMKLEELMKEINGEDEDTDIFNIDNKNVNNILLVGTDSRKKGNRRSRTDSMIILSIDKKNERITMTSVLRDCYVSIPGVGKNRLNAAFVFGGPNLLFKTFDENFDIHLNRYVQIDFYHFVDLIDTVDGVDLKLSAAEIKVMNKDYIPSINQSLNKKRTANLIKKNKTGSYHLNGVQALAYSRIRYVGNADFGRTERQRKILAEVIKKTKNMSVSELNNLADILLPMFSTNLTQGEVMSLLLNAKECLNYELVSGRMPIDGSYKYMTVRKASVLGVDFVANKKYWYQLVYGEK